MQIESVRFAEWVSRLVQIPSVAPEMAGLRAGKTGEARIAAAVADWFTAFGGEVHQHEVKPGRPNVYGLWRGKSQRWLAVDVHTDTVGVDGMPGDPFDGRVENGRVYGRGAVDTKATLGVVLALLEAMHRQGITPTHNLLIAATADEEIGATGAPAFADWLRAHSLHVNQLVVAEPTRCNPIHGHKGVCRLAFDIYGKSAHSSQPHLGQNAITAAAHLALALDAEHGRLQSVDSALGAPSLTVSLISGGQGINVVPDRCQLSVDRRLVVGEDPHAMIATLSALAEAACPLPFSVDVLLAVGSFYQPPDSPWLRQLAAWTEADPTVAPYGTNAWAYAAVADECVVLGPGSIEQAHGAEEWVEIAELEKVAAIYRRWWELGIGD